MTSFPDITDAAEWRRYGVDVPGVLAAVLPGYMLAVSGMHGLGHWARVLENGLRLVETTGGASAFFGMRFFTPQVPYNDPRFRRAVSIALDEGWMAFAQRNQVAVQSSYRRVWWFIGFFPAQFLEPRLQVRRRVISPGGDAPAGRADQAARAIESASFDRSQAPGRVNASLVLRQTLR